MLRLGVSYKFVALFVVTVVYAIVITISVFSFNRTCKTHVNTCVTVEKEVEVFKIEVEEKSKIPPWEQHLNFEGFNNESGTPDGHYIVPNYVHFVKFGKPEFNFPHAVCVLAAFKHQKPEKLFFHTDLDEFTGYYWNVMLNTTGFKDVLVIRKIQLPTEIFGQKLNPSWKYYHGGDVARLQVMMEFGGIYLDSDSYIVRSMDDLRRYEMCIGWRPGREMGNQVIVAHKDARYLHLWYESYRNNYKPKGFYYNAGSYPSFHILAYRPYLVHRMENHFGNYGIKQKTYLTDFPEWRNYYTLHLLTSHLKRGLIDPTNKLKYPVVFDHVNVLTYPVAFRDMCKAVYPFPETNQSNH